MAEEEFVFDYDWQKKSLVESQNHQKLLHDEKQQQSEEDLPSKLAEAIDIFRLKPRPSVEDAERVKLLLARMKQSMHASEEKWQRICSLVMEQCHKQQEYALDLLLSALGDPLETEETKLLAVQELSQDKDFPLVLGDKAVQMFRQLFALRKSMQKERADDARHLKQVVVKMQDADAAVHALSAQNSKLLCQNVEMQMQITSLHERIQGLETALRECRDQSNKINVARRSLHDPDDESVLQCDPAKIGQLVLSFIAEQQQQQQQRNNKRRRME